MRPFQVFRLWVKRGPATERAAASAVALLVVALLAWIVVPSSEGDAQDVTAAGGSGTGGVGVTDGVSGPAASGGGSATANAAGNSADGGTGPTPALDVGGAAAASEPGPTTPEGAASGEAPACASPSGTVRGVTDEEVHVAVALTEIVGPAANDVFDLPPPAEQEVNFEAVVAGINRDGGVACRTLVARYFIANPADESQMMQLCRDIAGSDVFAVIDTGSLASRPAVLACVGQQGLPYFGAFFITETARQQFYPQVFSVYTKEHLYWATAFGLRDLGFFDPSNGFVKLGFIYRDCEREAIAAFRDWIREAGVPDAQLVPYNVGCGAAFANPADLQQAVLTFQREGVTHVTAGNFMGDLPVFTNLAQQQGFRPRYGFPDETIVSLSGGSRAPNPDNIANAITVTLSRSAENQTPGMTPTAGTQRCDSYYQAAGRPPTYEQDEIAGNACNQLWMLQAALNRAPELSIAALPSGLRATGSIDFSFPQGPNDFTGDGVTTGGQFWRVAQFMPACDCWQVVEPEFQRSGYG
jgi:hypothetical protein